MSAPSVAGPSMTFTEASNAVLEYLKVAVPMGYWSVSRYDGTDQLYLAVRDDSYGKCVGDRHAWADSFCQYSVAGVAPEIAPDAMAVPEYAGAGVARQLVIGAYAGVGIYRTDGTLFGTICGLDPQVQSEQLARHSGLLKLLATLLGTILTADAVQSEQARQLERAQLLAETDHLTGLVNRHGWMRTIRLEEERYRRFGDPGAVIMLDLDRLKQINDRDGHAAGDTYIRRAATTLGETVRDGDLVARLGGDEFAVLATSCSPPEADALVLRLRSALRLAGIAGSFGHAPYTFVAGFPGACEAADAAMYEDKRRRRSMAAA